MYVVETAMEVHGFYEQPKHKPQSPKSEAQIILDRLIEAVQDNADSIKGVVQQMEVMSKEIYKLKTQNVPLSATPNHITCTAASSRSRIPSVLNVS